MVNQENGVDLKSATQSDERKLFIETYGCQMNVADSEVVASIMKMDGYSMTENIEEADAIFVNTCSVRDNAEQKIYGRLSNRSYISLTIPADEFSIGRTAKSADPSSIASMASRNVCT